MGAYKIPQQIRTGCSKRMIAITFQHFTALIPTQGPTLSQAREMCGRAKEKQTQARTKEKIPQGLSWNEGEVRQYLQCNPFQICTRCRALRGASPLWLSASDSVTQGKKTWDSGVARRISFFFCPSKFEYTPCLIKKSCIAEVISLFCHDSHRCLTFKYSITYEMSLLRIQNKGETIKYGKQSWTLWDLMS